jgi:hypothetical protein
MTQDAMPPARGVFARFFARLFGRPAAGPAPASPPPAPEPVAEPVAEPVPEPAGAPVAEPVAQAIDEPAPAAPPPADTSGPSAPPPAAPPRPISVSVVGSGVPDRVQAVAVTTARMGVVGQIVPPRKKLETDAVLPFAPHGPRRGDVRRLLLERARTLGHRMTREPDLRIAVGESEFRPVETRGQVHVFRFPAGPGAVRLRSRYGVPKRMYPDTMDDRTLGVFVGEMVFADAARRVELGAEDPALTEGWWDLEYADTSARRWTDGDALLPITLDGFAGEVTAEITIFQTMASWVEEPPSSG